jgi:hypothetical protein
LVLLEKAQLWATIRGRSENGDVSASNMSVGAEGNEMRKASQKKCWWCGDGHLLANLQIFEAEQGLLEYHVHLQVVQVLLWLCKDK